MCILRSTTVPGQPEHYAHCSGNPHLCVLISQAFHRTDRNKYAKVFRKLIPCLESWTTLTRAQSRPTFFNTSLISCRKLGSSYQVRLQEQHYPVLPVYMVFGEYQFTGVFAFTTYCAMGIIYQFCEGSTRRFPYSCVISNCLGIFHIDGQTSSERCFEPSQAQRITSELETNFNPSPSTVFVVCVCVCVCVC